ncbi:hypothetical protein [Entomospira culicis]|uniref:GWxTD domain-containing protein n=1 Tax=Entomospira culicis TaxID=2719989 RepID=A0A968GFK1_9SPIO|nr:hypothetical protein [Entomospira culicis]NIZ19507.1 hypothetical protein [Entomospira culicis]NIZ69588.1 hypothetical protein [Entomospira culicis]WDI36699.1 hypothetical protein PVA46_05075 [Entomospira culicis]WDI38328.1 hypothetical protein PVA47_05085 [Entomospira culicis]
MYKRLVSLAIASLLLLSTAFAQNDMNFTQERLLLEQSNFAENYEIRQNSRNIISSTQFNTIDISARIYTQESSTHRVRVSIVRMDDFFYVIFANEILPIMQNPRQANQFNPNQENTSYDLLLSDRFKMDGRGTYIIKKRVQDGTIEHIKIYLQSESESYILITPQGSSEINLDVFLFETPIYRNVRLPINLNSATTLPFSRIMASSSHVIDWNLLFLPLANQNARRSYLQNVIRQVELRLPELSYVADGMQNSNGTLVHGQTREPQQNQTGLGNLGFVKWIMDGFYSPLNQGKLSDISLLQNDNEPQLSSLTWNRNLSYFINKSIFSRRRIHIGEDDVRDTPFLTYTPEIGYPLSTLPAVIYLEAIRRPEAIYLGSINEVSATTQNRRAHLASIVIIPFFNEMGNLETTVFYNNQKMTLEDLHRKHRGAFIHLQRITTNNTTFQLPQIKSN